MGRYFFHICSRNERIEDLEGEDFDTVQAALAEARIAAREILADDILKGQTDETRRFEIVDSQGHLVARVPFSEALSHPADR
ncbi:DUF6894 family protein [Shinella sp. BYT-45]|uniref:DUF6894 family protein n=1 Tax=Shinella sp. BYT-45 TaxID=3377377 RepID=UPI0039809DD0